MFQIPEEGSSVDAVKSQLQTITCLAMSPSEEVLVCSTSSCQLYSFTLSSSDLGRVSVGELSEASGGFTLLRYYPQPLVKLSVLAK